MSKNVTTYECEQGTLLKSYETFVALKSKDGKHLVTSKWHSKTTTRQINEFFGGEVAEKVAQSTLDAMGRFIEAYNK
tara:strand:+ start:66 stop:296 length:231 start_codon:yes stop_codon:yes gene_type:complete